MKFEIFIDEVGRGTLAGDVYIGAIVKLSHIDNSIFGDSKTFSAKKRDLLHKIILELENEKKILYATGMSTSKQIDKYGIVNCLKLSIVKGIYTLIKKYIQYFENNNLIVDSTKNYLILQDIKILSNLKRLDYLLIKKVISLFSKINKIILIIDGNTDFGLASDLGVNVVTIIDGDKKNKNIGMSSIFAKVERDNYMLELSKKDKYKNYFFEKHKGYGTKLHIESIKKFGVLPIHRKSYLKKILGKKEVQSNFEKINDNFIIKNQKIQINKKIKLLLQVCCIVDLIYPYEMLNKYFDLYFFRYNPNINSKIENLKRFKQVENFIELNNLNSKFFFDQYKENEFENLLFENYKILYPKIIFKNKLEFINYIKKLPEGLERCDVCIFLRILKTKNIAKLNKIDYISSTLITSPKKDNNKIQKIKQFMNSNHTLNEGINFLYFDFDKNNGFEKGNDYCKINNYYIQNYCGCKYSKIK